MKRPVDEERNAREKIERLKQEVFHLQDELRALSEENELLRERSEDIFLLGIISEKVATAETPLTVISTALENVCILKELGYGAFIRPEGERVRVVTDYCEEVECSFSDQEFPLEGSVEEVFSVGQEEFFDYKEGGQIPAFIPKRLGGQLVSSSLFLPLSQGGEVGFLAFANYRYAPDYLRGLVPLLNRLIHVIRMRIETLLLLNQLSKTNIRLEEMVKERTERLQEAMDRLKMELDERRQAEERARESEEHFRMIFEQARDGIALIDPETGCVVESNPVFQHLTGRSEEELRKTPVWNLRPPDMVEAAKRKFYEIKERGEGGSAVLHFQRPDGSVVPIEFVSRRVDIGGRRFNLSLVRDISERVSFVEKLEQKKREMEVLYNLVSSAQRGTDIQSSLGYLEEALLDLLKPSLIMFYRKTGGELQLIRRYPQDEEAIQERKKLGECLCGSAAGSGDVILSGDILKDPRCTLNECKDAGMRSFAAIPLGAEDDMVGLIGLAWDEVRDFGEEGEFFHTLGAGLSLVFRNIALIEELKRHSHDLEGLVRERTNDLQRVVNLMAGRELRIKELKDVIDQLREQILSLGHKPVADDPLRAEDV